MNAMQNELCRLDGRIVVVSGAAGGGIGTSVARMVAQAGATVIAVSRSQQNLDRHVAPLAAEGLAVVAVAADASTDEGIEATMDTVRRTARQIFIPFTVGGGIRSLEDAAAIFEAGASVFTLYVPATV